MKSKILVVGFALASVFAVAQSNNSQADPAKKSSSDVKQPVDVNTGRVKTAMQKAEAPADASKATAREASTGMATGKVQRVATADVNGDGKADVAPGSNPNSQSTPSNATATPANATSSDVKSPRDLATGQASGKRQYQPVIIRKAVDDTPAEGNKKDPNKK
jgi:hypothetical protein